MALEILMQLAFVLCEYNANVNTRFLIQCESKGLL